MFASRSAAAAAVFARRACAAAGLGAHNPAQGAVLLAGGASCAAAATARKHSPGYHSCCAAKASTVHSAPALSRQVATATAGASSSSPIDGSDFAVFRRPPGSFISVEEEEMAMPTADSMKLDDLFNAISVGVAHDWFKANGRTVPQETAKLNVILLGEVHDDKVAHHLQLLILKHCLQACKVAGRRLVLSLEMFERDVQQVLDEYVVKRAIREQDFLQDSRPWGNYTEDYRPLVEFCREEGVRVVAANVPRRYVSLTAREGSRALQQLLEQSPESPQLASLLPPVPLPPASAAYHAKFVETIASQMPPPPPASEESSDAACPFIGFKGSDVRKARPEMVEAQLLWDHTMAQSIARSLNSGTAVGTGSDDSDSQVPLVVHVCGAFHCAHGLGIPEVLPLYSAMAVSPPTPRVELDEKPWLPMDAALSLPEKSVPEDTSLGPKQSPPGVISVICWPGSVSQTLEVIRGGQQVTSLGIMGDWVVITEETWGEGSAA